MDIIVDGLNAHAATGGRDAAGGEETVILIHGSAMDRTMWQMQSRSIAFRGRRVLAVDLPGHGRSRGTPAGDIAGMADWLSSFMAAAGVEKATLIGHSMGALIALDAASRYPAMVDRLVLMGVAEEMPVHPDLLAAAGRNDPLAAELIVYWGLGYESQIGNHRQPGLWLRGVCEALLKKAGDGVMAADLAACNNYATAVRSAKNVECPALFILGGDDKMTPPGKGLELAGHVADARSVVIEGSGHMMMIEYPDRVYEALKAFVF